MEPHNEPFEEGKFVVVAEVFFHYYELEVAYYIIALQALVATGYIYLFIRHKVHDHLPEHKVYPWLHPETEPEFYPDNIVGNDMLDTVVTGIRIIYCVYVNKPVNIGPL